MCKRGRQMHGYASNSTSTACTSRTLQSDTRQQRRPSAACEPTEARAQVPMRQRPQMLVQSISSLPNGISFLTVSCYLCRSFVSHQCAYILKPTESFASQHMTPSQQMSILARRLPASLLQPHGTRQGHWSRELLPAVSNDAVICAARGICACSRFESHEGCGSAYPSVCP